MDATEVEQVTDVIVFRSPRGVQARMHIRPGTNDWNTLNACMTEDEYGLRDLSLTGWAIDIGGYLGGVAIGLALDNPGLRVLVVEPVPDNADLIRRNIALNDLAERVTLIEGAVGNGDPVDVWYGYRGTVTAEHHRFVGNSSLAYDHGGELQHETRRYDESHRLLDLIEDTGVERIALLKIDCEGGEWEFLDTRAVQYVDRFVGEAHAVRGHKGWDIVAMLEATHDVTLQGDTEGTCEFRAVAR